MRGRNGIPKTHWHTGIFPAWHPARNICEYDLRNGAVPCNSPSLQGWDRYRDRRVCDVAGVDSWADESGAALHDLSGAGEFFAIGAGTSAECVESIFCDRYESEFL